MGNWFVVKDGEIIAQTHSYHSAIEIIKAFQQSETHYLLRSNYSVIFGKQEFIPYKI